MASIHSSAFIEEDDHLELHRERSDFASVWIVEGKATTADLSFMLDGAGAKMMRDFFNSREVTDFIEGRDTVVVPGAIVTGQSVLCPHEDCGARFDPTEDDRDAAFAGGTDILAALEARYAEHYMEAHRG